MPVKSRAPSFAALDTNHDGFLGPAEIATAGDDLGSGTPAESFATPGVLKRIDTNGDGRISQAEYYAAGSLIAGTAQLLALQSEESTPKAPARNASLEHGYDAAAALGSDIPAGTFIAAAA